MGRTVVIGLDGADWSLLDGYIEEGVCPNLARISREGVRGGMTSVDPPISVPAWLCFSTGKRPDRLDLYNFTRREKGTYNLHSVHNSEDYQRQAFWKSLDDIGVFNVPSTFPVGSYDGFLISGPISPEGFYPEDLKEEVRGSGFVRDLPKGWEFNESLQALERNSEIAARLFSDREPGFFLWVTSVPDRVQHAYWDDEEKMKRLWEEVDAAVGRVLEHVDLEEDNVFVLSDHGFSSIRKTFYLNTWLERNGYLELEDGDSSMEDLRFRLKKFARDFLVRTGLLEPALDIVPRRLQDMVEKPEDIWEDVDWENTVAVSSGQYVGQIYLNTEADFPKGTVSEEEYGKLRDELIENLKSVHDPETGEEVVEDIWRKEELYRDFGEHAPDITFYTKDMGYKVKEEFHGSVFDESIPSGAHSKTGVFLAAGESIGEGRVDLELVDFAPTLLHLEGEAVGEDMDGRVVKDIFAEDSDASGRSVREKEDTSGIDI